MWRKRGNNEGEAQVVHAFLGNRQTMKLQKRIQARSREAGDAASLRNAVSGLFQEAGQVVSVHQAPIIPQFRIFRIPGLGS